MTQTFNKISLAVVALATTAYYFFVNPSAEGSFTFPCLFKSITGYYCLGCGGQRAFHSLLHGNFTLAFHNNLLIFIVLPLVFIKIYEEIFDKNITQKVLHNNRTIWTITIIVFVFWVSRNLPFEVFNSIRPLP